MSGDENELDEVELENTLLKSELVAREFIMGAMLQKLGGKITLTKEDMGDLQLLVGTPEEVMEKSGGLVAKRIKTTSDAITFELVPKELKGKGN